jgi:hypothetical protein
MYPHNEVCVIPTYKRPEFLYACVRRIREIEPDIPIAVFPDCGTWGDDGIYKVAERFMNENFRIHYVPEHSYHGNSMNALEALRWAFNDRYDLTFYIEDDVMVHQDFFEWHRTVQEEWPDIFCSMAWVFNRHAPLADDYLFQPWYYAIGTCFRRSKLLHLIEHCSPLYYADMQGYIEKRFQSSKLNTPFGIEHYEQDGLIQRVIDLTRTQTCSPGIAKCTHAGLLGYNRGWTQSEEFFKDCGSFEERVERVEEFIADPYWRAEVFGRDVVEREIGRKLPKREFRYRMTLPGGWESEFQSELTPAKLPKRINSVPVTAETNFVLI